jgi:hypothetical protein
MGFPPHAIPGLVLAVAAQALALTSLAPEDFRSMANASVSVLGTQREYLDDFARERARETGTFFFYLDLRYALPETDRARVSVPATAGDMQGELRKGRLGFCLQYLSGDYAFGAYDIAEGFSVSAPRAWNPGYLRYYGKDTSAAGDPAWSQGYQNFAFTLERAGRFRVAAGLFDRSFPLFADSGAGARFALEPAGDSSSPWRGSRDVLQGFLDAEIGGYGFSSLYTLGGGLDLMGIRRRWAWGEAEIVPAANYFRYRRRCQIGAEANGFALFPVLDLGAEAYADSRRGPGGRRGAYGHAEATVRYHLWGWGRTAAAGRPRFGMAATLSGGWSDDALESPAWGHAEGLAFERIFGVVGFSASRSVDEPRALQQMPLRGASVWNFDFKLAW